MRKVLFGMFIAVILLFSNVSNAYDLTLGYSTVVTNSTPNYQITNVATATIIPGVHKITGFTVIPREGSSAGAWATLYDASSGYAESQLLGENETTANSSWDFFFPYPRTVSTQLTVIQSQYSHVIVHYTR